jgi:hypothetical protein
MRVATYYSRTTIGEDDMAQTIALGLAAIGGGFVHAAFVSKGMLSMPPPDVTIYYLTVAFIAFVKAGLFAAANTATE